MKNVYTHFPQVKKKHCMLLDMDHLALPKGFQAKFMKNETVSPSFWVVRCATFPTPSPVLKRFTNHNTSRAQIDEGTHIKVYLSEKSGTLGF